jgi:hypothetical protein
MTENNAKELRVIAGSSIPTKILAESDQWWEDHLREAESAMHVVVFAMCALSGAIVGFLIGLLI